VKQSLHCLLNVAIGFDTVPLAQMFAVRVPVDFFSGPPVNNQGWGKGRLNDPFLDLIVPDGMDRAGQIARRFLYLLTGDKQRNDVGFSLLRVDG
jgi:hypothetical protein